MIRTILAPAALVLLATTPALAFPACGDTDQVKAVLLENYAEHATAFGVADNGSLLEVLSSTDGSWTLLMTRPDGISCLVAAGEQWQRLPVEDDLVAGAPEEPAGEIMD